MCAGDGVRSGHSLIAPTMLAPRPMVWVAVGRSGDELVGQVEPGE
jgi:hypothetical protein